MKDKISKIKEWYNDHWFLLLHTVTYERIRTLFIRYLISVWYLFNFGRRKSWEVWTQTFLFFTETSRRCCPGNISRTSRSTGLYSIIERSLVQSEENIGRNLGWQDQIQVSLPVASPLYCRFYRPARVKSGLVDS